MVFINNNKDLNGKTRIKKIKKDTTEDIKNVFLEFKISEEETDDLFFLK